MLKVAFLGFGEAAFEIAKGLKTEGLESIKVFDKVAAVDSSVGEVLRKRAAEAGVVIKKELGEAVQGADYVFSTVVSSAAVAVAEAAAPFLNSEQIYVDFNSTSPEVKKKVGQIVAGKGVRYVEAAVMAAVPGKGHKVPLLVCGDSAERFTVDMSAYRMNIEFLGAEIGRASAVKMCRSLIVKGLESLFIEALVAGRKYQVEEIVVESLMKSFPYADFRKLANHLMPRSAVHAARRSHEMAEAAATVEGAGFEAVMARAAVQRLSWLAEFDFKSSFTGVLPEGFGEVLETIEGKLS